KSAGDVCIAQQNRAVIVVIEAAVQGSNRVGRRGTKIVLGRIVIVSIAERRRRARVGSVDLKMRADEGVTSDRDSEGEIQNVIQARTAKNSLAGRSEPRRISRTHRQQNKSN